MKWSKTIPSREKWLGWLKQYKLILILVLVGAVLLAMPVGSGSDSKPAAQDGKVVAEETFSVKELETRLSQAVSRIRGAGKSTVMLTLNQGVERVLATDTMEEQRQDERTQEKTTVVNAGKEGEDVVVVTQYYPDFRGALVVCPGGDDPRVRLTVTEAVSALTGLGSDRITVCVGE